MRRVVFGALGWATAVVACGGEASTSERPSGDGDGDESGDGDSPGSGGGPVLGDGDGDSANSVDRSCEETTDCALVTATCCGTCGVPTLADVTAMRVSSVLQFRGEICPDDVGCPDCLVQNNPNLYAVCNEGKCEAVDLTERADSACSLASECTLLPAFCCACGAGTDVSEVVAINRDRSREFVASRCATQGLGEPVACDDCLWSAPDAPVAECTSGHCSVGMGAM